MPTNCNSPRSIPSPSALPRPVLAGGLSKAYLPRHEAIGTALRVIKSSSGYLIPHFVQNPNIDPGPIFGGQVNAAWRRR